MPLSKTSLYISTFIQKRRSAATTKSVCCILNVPSNAKNKPFGEQMSIFISMGMSSRNSGNSRVFELDSSHAVSISQKF